MKTMLNTFDVFIKGKLKKMLSNQEGDNSKRLRENCKNLEKNSILRFFTDIIEFLEER